VPTLRLAALRTNEIWGYDPTESGIAKILFGKQEK
jgi:hypothetical protein